MTFEKEEGVNIKEEEKEHYPGPHIFPDMLIELVEDMLIDAPSENKHIFGEVSFGIRGIDKKPLFYPYDRVIENTIKWFYLFKETVEIYQEIEKLPPRDLETKGSSKRILTKEEKEYILSVARGSKLPLIAAAKQVLTNENIEFLRRGYYYIKEVSLHLESLDKGELIQELKDKGLYPIKPEPDHADKIERISSESILSYINSVTPEEKIEPRYYEQVDGKDTESKIDDKITMKMVDKKMEKLKGSIEEAKEEPVSEQRFDNNAKDSSVKIEVKELPKLNIGQKIKNIFKKPEIEEEETDPFKEEKHDPFDEAT